MAKSKIYIHATNIHQGGGKSLLDSLIGALVKSSDNNFVLILDARMHLSIDVVKNIEVKRVAPTIIGRLLAERWLAKVTASNDYVLCFGNLPPLFSLQSHTIVFLQNRYLAEHCSLKALTRKVRFRLLIERFWLMSKISNADEFFVQTQTMKILLDKMMKGRSIVKVLPFVENPNGYVRSSAAFNTGRVTSYDFIYVASGESHKNHKTLFEAWCILANEGHYPSLCTTLEATRFPELCQLIEDIQKRFSVKIFNLGVLDNKDVMELYPKCRAAIYPSKFESFGLPLIEARQAGLPIIASELDYVRDIVDPEQAFDPYSAISIAKAVKRFIGAEDQTLPLLSASDFLAKVLKRTNQ